MNDSDNSVIDDDYDQAKGVYLDLISRGQEALQNMMDVAEASEHPRAYEVLANLIKTVSDTNDKVMDLNKKTREVKNKSDSRLLDDDNGSKSTTNNVFIGSTTDLQRMLQDVDKAPIDITPDE